MIGGSQATTLEVLIWQTLRIDANFSRALGIALLQLISILVLTLLLRSRAVQGQMSRASSPLLANLGGLPIVLLPSLLLIVALLDRPWIGASMFFQSDVFVSEVFHGLAGSFFVAIGTGAFVIALLMLLAFINPVRIGRRLLLGYVAPSSVITGFAMLIIWRAIGLATYFKIMIALTLIAVPSFYRLYWDATLSSLKEQRTIAMTLGASDLLTFQKVVLPQILRPAFFIAALSSLWAWGDFAISRVIAERDVTLGLTIQSLMGSYRFEIATFLIWILLLGGAATFFLFEGVGRVIGQKSTR